MLCIDLDSDEGVEASQEMSLLCREQPIRVGLVKSAHDTHVVVRTSTGQGQSIVVDISLIGDDEESIEEIVGIGDVIEERLHMSDGQIMGAERSLRISIWT
jgi:hypothetical protein